MRHFAPFLLVLLVVPPLAAAELTLTGGGARVLDLDPTTANDNCSAVTYAPSPAGEYLYVSHDRLVNHCKFEAMSSERFGDKIAVSRATSSGWSAPEIVLDRSSLPWMQDEAYLSAHPDAYVGHVTSPSVVRIGGRWYMSFVAAVNDPNLCAGEHPASGTPCGSCRDPWSYFVAMWAVSDDGIHWRVRAPELGRANRALDAALLWREPLPHESSMPSEFKGVTRVAMIDHVENGRGWFYILLQFWSRAYIRVAVVRIAYDESSEWGISGDPQLWTFYRGWEGISGGEIPGFIDSPDVPGPLPVAVTSVARTSLVPGYRYIAFSIAAGQNAVSWLASNDLVQWTPPRAVRSTIHFAADGRGYDASTLDPTYYEDAGGVAHLLLASADGDEAAGVARDGAHDCSLPSRSDVPTAPYIGTGIYDFELSLREAGLPRLEIGTPRAK